MGPTGVGPTRPLVSGPAAALRARSGHPIEEVDNPGLERVLRADNQEPVGRDEAFEQRRTAPEMIRRGADIGADRMPDQRIRVTVVVGRDDRGQRGPDPLGLPLVISSSVARIAPHCECPITTTSRVP